MCLDCLKNSVEGVSNLIDGLRENLNKMKCECCKQGSKAFIDVACSIKMYGVIKVRKNETECEDEKQILNDMEIKCKQKIVTLLNNMIESIDCQKDDITDGVYLKLMNNVNEMNKYFKDFDEIESNM